jgi:hypothetical protein
MIAPVKLLRVAVNICTAGPASGPGTAFLHVQFPSIQSNPCDPEFICDIAVAGSNAKTASAPSAKTFLIMKAPPKSSSYEKV